MDMPSGQTIARNDDSQGQSGPQPPAGQPAAPPSASQPEASTVDPTIPQSGAAAQDAHAIPQSTPWEYGAADVTPMDAGSLPGDVSWTAAEFIEHQKSTRWYGLLVLAAVAVAGTDFLFTHDFISTGVIVLTAAMFGAYAGHKPRTQQYHLSPEGLQIGERLYDFQIFRNFSVTAEGNLAGIVFMPLKRFAPPLTIYVAPDIEDQVLNYLSNFLPLEQHRADAVDSLLRRIRF